MADEITRAEDNNRGAENDAVEDVPAAEDLIILENVEAAEGAQNLEAGLENQGEQAAEDAQQDQDDETIVAVLDNQDIQEDQAANVNEDAAIVVNPELVQCPLCLQFFRSVRGVQTHMARSAVCNQDRRNIFTVDHQLALNPNLGQALIPVPRRRRSPTQQQVENVSVNIFEILFMSCSWAAFLAEKIFLCIACVFFFILILSNSSFLTFDDTLASKAASFLEEFQPNPIGTALSTVGWIFTFLIDKIFQ
ncbi:uncharacterized protein EV154DRAFT_488299 [Mucor mucedo]|uniref:uncharacterized protein n=1 Tax=Mucor mucedo TaxID=29922 RepID=UPI00221E87A4|nr:uncharacterized protein EV154DRAFT_488299 [Mucor mucedo]KAI7867618.1 hypothetical protein EV154DRAFT_488299 [Mucor mucedo]